MPPALSLSRWPTMVLALAVVTGVALRGALVLRLARNGGGGGGIGVPRGSVRRGKRALERRLLSRPRILHLVNSMRRRRGAQPLSTH